MNGAGSARYLAHNWTHKCLYYYLSNMTLTSWKAYVSVKGRQIWIPWIDVKATADARTCKRWAERKVGTKREEIQRGGHREIRRHTETSRTQFLPDTPSPAMTGCWDKPLARNQERNSTSQFQNLSIKYYRLKGKTYGTSGGGGVIVLNVSEKQD